MSILNEHDQHAIADTIMARVEGVADLDLAPHFPEVTDLDVTAEYVDFAVESITYSLGRSPFPGAAGMGLSECPHDNLLAVRNNVLVAIALGMAVAGAMLSGESLTVSDDDLAWLYDDDDDDTAREGD